MRNDGRRGERRAKEGRTTKSIKQVPTYPSWLAFPRAENAPSQSHGSSPRGCTTNPFLSRPLSILSLSFLFLVFLILIRRPSFSSSSLGLSACLLKPLISLVISSRVVCRSEFRLGWFVRSFAVMPAANSVVPRSRCIAPWPRSCQSRRKKRIAVSVALLPMLFLHTARTFHSVSRRREIVNEQSYRSYLLLRGLRRRSSTSSSGDSPNSGTTDDFG